MVNRLYVYDNSIDNAFPTLLFRAVEGKVEKVYADVSPWAMGILQKAQPCR
jgi:hypothetical protein